MNTRNKRINQPIVHFLLLHVATNNMIIVDDNFLQLREKSYEVVVHAVDK